MFLLTVVQSKPLVDSDAIVFRDSDEEFSSDNGSLEYGEHFQGDIKLSAEQEELYFNKSGKIPMADRTGLINEAYRWPKTADGFVMVPFDISKRFSMDAFCAHSRIFSN